MEKDKERLQVIENIRKAVENKEFNSKVELHDHIVTDEERERVILKYDSRKKKIRNKAKTIVARSITDSITDYVNIKTEIKGIENIKGIKTGAIITSNHFSKIDNTIIRYLMHKIGKKRKFDIIVQETNIFMPGCLGWLLKNNRTIPINKSHQYISTNFEPTLEKLFKQKHFVLIYPEEEMWFNYKKPRPGKIGAYHYACKYDVPIIPCFVEMQNTDKIGDDGFYIQRYVLHVMKPLYPDTSLDFKAQKEDLRKRDYDLKVAKYEEVYKEKFDDKFEIAEDIAGWN